MESGYIVDSLPRGPLRAAVMLFSQFAVSDEATCLLSPLALKAADLFSSHDHKAGIDNESTPDLGFQTEKFLACKTF